MMQCPRENLGKGLDMRTMTIIFYGKNHTMLLHHDIVGCTGMAEAYAYAEERYPANCFYYEVCEYGRVIKSVSVRFV